MSAPQSPPRQPTGIPPWFLMVIAFLVTGTWVVFALTISDPGKSQNFLTVTGIFGIVVTTLFGATYVKRGPKE